MWKVVPSTSHDCSGITLTLAFIKKEKWTGRVTYSNLSFWEGEAASSFLMSDTQVAYDGNAIILMFP